MQRRSGLTTRLAVLAVTSVALSGCALFGVGQDNAGETPGTYTVTFIGPLSGSAADLGTRPADAVGVLFDRINAEGGVQRPDGSTVRLVLEREDDQGTPQGQTQAIRKAARTSDALIGGMLSSPTIAGMDIAQTEGIPYNIVGAVSADIEEKIAAQGMNFVFHSAPNAAARAGADMQALADLHNVRNVYVIAQDTDYGRDMVAGAEEFLRAKVPGSSLQVDYVSAGATQYSTQLLRMREAQPKADVVYAVLAGQEMFSFMQQKAAAGDSTLVYGGSSTPSSSIYIDTLGAAVAEGTITNSIWIPGMGGEAGKAFADAYQAATKRAPADIEAQAYDGALMLVEAIRNASTLDRPAVAEALVKAEVDGLRGHNSFDPENHGSPGLTFVVTQIQDGKFVPIWPTAVATGSLETSEP
jgi:branched-chain amino acid transport system substrate-binding protein